MFCVAVEYRLYSSTAINDINQEFFINRQPFQYVNSYLYIGIDIDEHLTIKKTNSTLFKNVLHKLHILRKVRPTLNKKASIDIVKTMICSIIDYGTLCIGSCKQQDLSDLQVLQNSALRCCYTRGAEAAISLFQNIRIIHFCIIKILHYPFPSIFFFLNFNTLKYIIIFHHCLIFHKI